MSTDLPDETPPVIPYASQRMDRKSRGPGVLQAIDLCFILIMLVINVWIVYASFVLRDFGFWADVLTGVEAIASLALLPLLIRGAIELGPERMAQAVKLHRRYVAIKLPLAFVFAVGSGWGLSKVVSSFEEVMMAAFLMLVLSAMHPLIISAMLRNYPRV